MQSIIQTEKGFQLNFEVRIQIFNDNHKINTVPAIKNMKVRKWKTFILKYKQHQYNHHVRETHLSS